MSPQQEQDLAPQCPDLCQLGLSQHHLPSQGDMCGRCSGWVFPWGQQQWLAVFRAGGCLGTELCSSMALCPPPPSLSGSHSGLAWGWDGFSEPCDAEPFPLALSLWQLWQLCGRHRAGLVTLKVISGNQSSLCPRLTVTVRVPLASHEIQAWTCSGGLTVRPCCFEM